MLKINFQVKTLAIVWLSLILIKPITLFAAEDALPDSLGSTASTIDPYEKFNRAVFNFNEGLDKLIIKPIAKLYNAIMPKPLNEGIHNVFLNVGELPTIGNDILQLKFHQMANDGWRLVVNTTLGVGGLFDVGSRIGLVYYSNDFGLTMAYYGYRQSNYLVLPFFGPNTIRDGIAIPVDLYAFSIYKYIQPDSTRYQVYALNVIDQRAQLLQYQSVMDEVALDKYVFMRNAYLQRRSYQIRQSLAPRQIVEATPITQEPENYNQG